MARGIDDHLGADARGRGPACLNLDPIPCDSAANDGRIQDQVSAAILKLPLQGEEIAMTIEEARDFSVDRDPDLRIECRLEPPGLGPVDQPGFFNPVRQRPLQERGRRRRLAIVNRHDQLAALVGLDAARGAILIELAPTLDAEPRLERAGRVIKTRMDDFGIARGGFGGDRRGRLEHQDLPALERERPRAGKADCPRANDHCIRLERVHEVRIIPTRARSRAPPLPYPVPDKRLLRLAQAHDVG